MSEIKHITLGAGEHHHEPMIVEAGAHSVRVVLEAGAHLHVAAFVLAVEQAARLSIEVDIEGEGAEFHFNALFVARGTEEAVINVRVNHMVPGCVSRQLIKGIVADAATGSFTGMVHVAPGAMGTYAVQRNQNLQLTDTAHVFTRPQLEIYADDVRCSHGATVGRLDPEAIYYMRQRGVSEVEARRLQMQGFVDEIVNHCPSEAFRKSISMRIGTLIDRL